MVTNKSGRLILARHGNTFESDQTPTYVGAASDLPLTKTGQDQARKLAQEIKKFGLPTSIFSGPLKRHKEMASIVATEIGFDVDQIEVSNALNEIHYGSWEGLTQEQIEAKWQEEFSAWSERGVWPEQIFNLKQKEFFEPVKGWVSEVFRIVSSGSNAIAITSNGTLRYINAVICGEDVLTQPKKVKVGTGNYCVCTCDLDTFLIEMWNVKP